MASKSIHKWRSLSLFKLRNDCRKHAFMNLELCCGAVILHREKQQYCHIPLGAQQPQRYFGIFTFCMNFGAHKLIRSERLFGLLSALHCEVRTDLYRCTFTFSALKYCSGILLKSFCYTKLCTQLFRRFLEFSQFSTAILRIL